MHYSSPSWKIRHQGCFLCGSISSFRFEVFDSKNENICFYPKVQNRTSLFFDLRIRWPKSAKIRRQNPTTWAIRFSIRKHGMVSKFKFYPRKQAAAERSMSCMVTQRRCFVPDAQSAVGASLRGQTIVGWHRLEPRDQEKRIRRAPLRGYVLATTAAAISQSVNVLVSDGSSGQNTKYRNRLTRAYSARLFAARPEAVSVGLDAWTLRPVQRTRRVLPRRQTATKAFGLGVCSKLCTHD